MVVPMEELEEAMDGGQEVGPIVASTLPTAPLEITAGPLLGNKSEAATEQADSDLPKQIAREMADVSNENQPKPPDEIKSPNVVQFPVKARNFVGSDFQKAIYMEGKLQDQKKG